MRKILYIIPLFIFAFTFTGGPPQGWYQQNVPDLGGRNIQDITFIDSTTGFLVTNFLSSPNDTGYILKTTNGGDNWFYSFRINKSFTTVTFTDHNTGYACGGGGFAYLCKTTDGGINWTTITTPATIIWQDMHIHNEDTLYLVDNNGINGGVFRSTNGGVNWVQQLNLGSQNPSKVYMYDGNTGYISDASTTYLRKTTNGGTNWDIVAAATGFTDIQFLDANTGWKARNSNIIQHTTNGGFNWTNISLPPKSSTIVLSRAKKLAVLNPDTIWVAGSVALLPEGLRAILFITTDGGQTWGYQVTDTTGSVGQHEYLQFLNKEIGWAYSTAAGDHTITGGDDTTIYLGIQQTSSIIPEAFKLYQNYPNPFNPSTNLKFKIKSSDFVKLNVFDITGKEVAILVNEKLSAGEYEYTFNGSSLSSGVYFYRLQTIDFIDTKKMLLIK